MLVGYVSDERYVALEGVAIEFERDGETVAVVVHAARQGHRRGRARHIPGDTAQGRVRGEGRSRWIWRRARRRTSSACCRTGSTDTSGRAGSARASGRAVLPRHGVVPADARALWRESASSCGSSGWYDEHGPNAVMQITPDGDWTQSGIGFNRIGFANNPHHTQIVHGARSGRASYYVEQKGESGAWFAAPWVVAPARGADEPDRRGLPRTPGTRTTTSAAAPTTSTRRACRPSRPSTAARSSPLPRGRARPEWFAPDGRSAAVVRAAGARSTSSPRGADRDDPIAGRQGNHLAPGRMAPARLAGAQGLRLRRLRRRAARRRHPRPRRVPRADRSARIPSTGRGGSTSARRTGSTSAAAGFVYLGGNGLNCEVELSGPGVMMRTKTHSGRSTAASASGIRADPTHWLDRRFHATVGPRRAPGGRHDRDRDHDRRAVPGGRRRPLGLRGTGLHGRATCSGRRASTSACPAARPATRPTR